MPHRSQTDTLVVLVEDEGAARAALETLLRSAGFGVASYASSADLLELLQHCHPDCVVMDLVMPGVDGYDILSTLQRELGHMPVIVLTDQLAAHTSVRALAMGAAACLDKACNATMLIGAVDAALQSKRAHLELSE